MQDFFLDTLDQNLQLHSNTGPTDFWLQTPVDGLEMPNLRISQYDKPGENSTVISNMLYSAHTVNLVGMVRSDTAVQYEINRRRIMQALAITRDSNGFITPKRCTFTMLSGDQFFFDAFMAAKPVLPQADINWTNFQIQLLIPKGLIFGNQAIDSGQVTRPSGGGFILPVIGPIVSSGATGGSTTIYNLGNATTPISIRLTGPLTNPFIRNAANGLTMQLTYTIPGGSYVDVDMYEKTILLNDDSSVLSTRTDDSDWWGLEPGNNVISFNTSDSTDTGNMEITGWPGYLGV